MPPNHSIVIKMKDRIKQIMESQHMCQQVFAEFIGISPATLSQIFTDRTKPSIKTVEAIKKKLPTLSTDWLMFGKEPMYLDTFSQEGGSLDNQQASSTLSSVDAFLDFDSPLSPTPQNSPRTSNISTSVRNTRSDIAFENMNNLDKTQRKVTEIRVFYDDQTWESFIPSKK